MKHVSVCLYDAEQWNGAGGGGLPTCKDLHAFRVQQGKHTKQQPSLSVPCADIALVWGSAVKHCSMCVCASQASSQASTGFQIKVWLGQKAMHRTPGQHMALHTASNIMTCCQAML